MSLIMYLLMGLTNIQGSQCLCDFVNRCLEFIESLLESFESLYYLLHIHKLRPSTTRTLDLVKF